MSAKAKVSFEWLSGCSGCEFGLLDLHEKLLAVLDEIDLVRMPILMDTKAYVDADIGLISGSIRTEHDVEAAHEMRRSCERIIAMGTCPVYGGPQSGAYAHTNTELLEHAFVHNPTTQTHDVPNDVPVLLEGNRPLDSEIEVDIYMPGCPPHSAFIFEGLMALLRGRGARIGRHNVCFSCERQMVRSDEVSAIRRRHDGIPDPGRCFLSQGYLCFGSVTLDRCMAPCPQVGTPCFSCGGPSQTVILEPPKDVRTMVATTMAHLTRIPYDDVVREIERQAKTHYAYAMSSPVFRQKPTFLLKKWLQEQAKA